MERLEHIGIAVRDIGEASTRFAALLGSEVYKVEEVGSEGVRTAFFSIGGVKIELLEATRPDSPIARFIEKRGEGVHHLAFEVSDLSVSISKYSGQGFKMISETPKPGADNKMIAFMHPSSSHGVLVELCEEKKKKS